MSMRCENNITNLIQRDIIKGGLTYAQLSEEGVSTGDNIGRTYVVTMKFKDSSTKILRVHQRFTKTTYRINGTTEQDDDFYIEYGSPDDMIRYDLPNLGEMKGTYVSDTTYMPMDDTGKCYGDIRRISPVECRVSKNLQINNVLMTITNENNPQLENRILSIYIGFYHSDLGTKYAINIVAPIDYKLGSVDQNKKFPTSASPNHSAIYYPDIDTYKN